MSSITNPPPAAPVPDGALKKRIWGWWFFDVASQPYFTLGLTFVFGPYFASVATDSFMAGGLGEQAADAQAQSLWSLMMAVTGLFIAILAPFLGAFADTVGRRMPWIVAFSLFYIFGAAGLWLLTPDGDFLYGVLICFGIGIIGAEFTTIFTNSLLPDLGTKEEIGGISGSGFAMGYAGGVVALAIMLLLFVEQPSGVTLIGLDPAFGLNPAQMEGTRFVGPFIALWFILFMIPFFLWVREKPVVAQPKGGPQEALAQLLTTLKSLPRRVSLFAFLGSSMFYRDALVMLYSFGGTYAVLVLNWEITQVGIFGVIAAITSAVASWIGGKVDSRLGPKPVVLAMIIILMAVCTFILGMTRQSIWGVALPEGSSLPDTAFFICGAVIGGAGGVLQSTSRSLMCRHASPAHPTEAFGLYALSGKATAFLAPTLVGITTATLGDARLGMVPLIFLFGIGLILLIWVDKDGTSEVAQT